MSTTESVKNRRQRAENKLRTSGRLAPGDDCVDTLEAQPYYETLTLLHELQVHQVELEMENEELRIERVKLEVSENRYFDLYDLAPIGYITLVDNGNIQLANLSAATMLGVQRSFLINKQLLQFISHKDLDVYNQQIKSVIDNNESQDWTMRLMRANGTQFWAHVYAKPRNSGEFLIAFSDISTTRNIEEELELLHKNIEERVGDMITELRRKDQALIRQNNLASMGEMLSNIAHQWRQPLNNVGLIIQGLQLEYNSGTLTSDEMNSSIDNVMEIIQQMSNTIDDFRNFFRDEKEKYEFSIINAVNHSVKLVCALLNEQDVKVEIKSDENVTAIGYQNEYSQVLLNLITNACGACLDRCVPKGHILIRIIRENERSVLYFHDNCGGIPDDVMPKIFDPYFTTRGPDKGTGIGLYMSKMIIEQNMGGSLTVRNVDGGAEFRIEV